MVDNEAKGNQYLAEAQKKLKSSQGFFGGLLGFVFKRVFLPSIQLLIKLLFELI
jgi:hypothetical protein